MQDALKKIDTLKQAYKLYDKHVAHILGISDVTIRRWRTGDAVPEQIDKHLDKLFMLKKKDITDIVNDAKSHFKGD